MSANDKISEWAGKPCTCVKLYDFMGGEMLTTYWGNCPMHGNNGRPIPWQTSDRRAGELLLVLVEKGHCPELYYSVDSEGFSAWYFSVNPGHMETYFTAQTISGAITAAILKLIEGEKP